MNKKIIKKIASATLCACLFTSVTSINVFAQSPVFDFTVPKFSSKAPYVVSNGITYNFIKEPGNVSLGEVSVGNNQDIPSSDVSIPNVITVKGKSYAVTKIEDGAFSGNTAIETLSFGKSVQDVTAAAFLNCPSLNEINVSSESPYFKSENGILYDISFKTLIKYPDSREDPSYTVNSQTNKIADYAFFGSDFIKDISMPVNLYEIGKYAFADCSTVELIKMGVNVKEIGDYAFYKSGIRILTLSPSITSIGKGAFAFSDIGKINLPTNLEEIKEGTFYNCENLKELTFGDNLRTIGDYAFTNINVTSLKLTDKINTIGKYAFANCESLKTITLNDILSTINDGAFSNCSSIKTIDLPKSLNELGKDVFTGCVSLETFTAKRGNPKSYTVENGILYNKNVTTLIQYPPSNISSVYTLPSSLSEIEDNALNDCKYINEFELNNSGRYFSIEDGILYDYHMTKLIKYPLGKGGGDFTVPDTVTEIASGAFKHSDISGIINLPSSLNKIGEFAFEDCPNISSFNTNNNNYFTTEDSVLYSKDKTELIQFPRKSFLTNFTVPDTVTKIHPGALSGVKLKTIQLNENLEEIGDYAFENAKIAEIILPESLKKIGEFSFSNTIITQITFPSSVEKIGDYAFENCANLKTIKFTSKNPPEIGNNTFLGCENLASIKLMSEAENSKNTYMESLTSLNIDNTDNYISLENN